jgi:hypothetical protein
VSRKEIKITFWLDEHTYQKLQKTSAGGAPEGGAKVIQFSNFSSANQDQNEEISFSSIRKNGRQSHTFPALFQPHKNIELLSADGRRISAHLVEFYQKGMSLSDLAEQTGRAQSSVRDILIRAGVQLRPKSAVPVAGRI